MAGPTCSIVLERELAEEQLQQLERMIASVSGLVKGEDFWVQNTIPIGGSYRGQGLPFLLEIVPSDRITALEYWTALEVEPRGQVTFAAMCNGAVDHRVLAELAVWAARKLNGWIDLHGRIDWSMQWNGELPGRLRVGTYDACAGPRDLFLIDADLLAAWLRHP